MKNRVDGSCRPNSLLSLPLRGSVGKLSPQPRRRRACVGISSRGPSFTQSVHFSPLEEPLLRGMIVASKEKKESGEENQEKTVSFYFFSKCVEEQSRADV